MAYSGFDLSGKVVLVTGGTSGIGRAIALGLVKSGARVLAGSSSAGKVDAMKAELGGEHEVMQIDVASEASVNAAVERAVKRFGRIDGSVNAAGVIKRQPSFDMPVEEFRRIVDINLVGTFIVARAVGKVMKDQAPAANGERGSIVNVASLNSFISLSEVLAYASSKSGVMGVTRGLANEWGAIGIRVNGLAPGIVPTELNRKLIEGTPRGDWLKAHTPLGRFAQADEMVGAALFLLSPSASFVNGETIIVDGGFLAKGV